MSRTTLACLLLLAAAAAPPQEAPKGEEEKEAPPTEEVVIRRETFRLEIAADEKARTRGLSGRGEIKDRGGMIFIWPTERRRSFWMKDCLVDIDLIFLARRGRIVALHKMKVELPQGRFEGDLAYERRLRRYPSRHRAQFAIELKAGSIKRLRLKPGEVIKLDAERLVELIPEDEEEPPES